MKQHLLAATLGLAMLISPAAAVEKVTNVDKIQMQVAMQKSITHQLIDGKYLYFDAAKASVVTLFPTQVHPMILRMGPRFILCSDFKTKVGKSANIDFYIARKGNAFVVFDTVVNNRKSIENMMKAGQVSVVN